MKHFFLAALAAVLVVPTGLSLELPSFPASKLDCSAFISDRNGDARKISRGEIQVRSYTNKRTVVARFEDFSVTYTFHRSGRYTFSQTGKLGSARRSGSWQNVRPTRITAEANIAGLRDRGTFQFLDAQPKLRINTRLSATTYLNLFGRKLPGRDDLVAP